MNKLWLLLLIPLLLVGFACVSTDTAPAADSIASRITAVQDTVTKHTSVIDALKLEVEKKASKAEIDDINRKINNLPQSGSTPTDVYTKAQVNQAIADAITALKAGANPWANAANPTPTQTGTVTFTTSPVSVPQLFTAASGSQSTFYTMKIVNNSTTWQYVKPIVNLTLASSYSPTQMSAMTVNMTYGSFALTGTNFSISPALGTSTSSIVIIPISGGVNSAGEFQVGSGASVDVLIQITGVTTSTTVLWNISNSISSRSM
jgi:hypothetical protein